jgi:uncharacterized membrane protein YfcA
MEYFNKSVREGRVWWLLVGGLAAGFVNGLLGAGGGIIVIFVLTKLFGSEITEKNAVFGNALCVMLPISVLTCALYASRGYMSPDGFGVFAIPAILGGVTGGILLGRLDTAFLKKSFAGLVIISGIIMMVR